MDPFARGANWEAGHAPPPISTRSTAARAGSPATCGDPGSRHLRAAVAAFEARRPARRRPRESGTKAPPSAGPFLLGLPAVTLHLPIYQPAFLQLVRRLERLRAAAREFVLALLLVRRRGAALGFPLVDFLLHRRRRGRGGVCVLAESVSSRQRRGEDEGEAADCGGDLHGISFSCPESCLPRATRVLQPCRQDSAQSFTLSDISAFPVPTNARAAFPYEN